MVAVAHNPEKQALFTPTERVAMLWDSVHHLQNISVVAFNGLLVEFAQSEKACAIIRGLRAVSDFELEFQMALMNRRLAPTLETLFLMPREDCSYLSSRLVKEVASLGGDISTFVPNHVAVALRAKFHK